MRKVEIVECPGHSGKCRFCKSKGGYARIAGGTNLVEVDKITGEKRVDFCCRKCAKNQEYLETKLNHPNIAAVFGTRIPRKGDELPRGTW